jgi:hypothetical protein
MPHPLIDPSLSRSQSLSHHLQYNHYPPIDLRWVPICEKAIDIAVTAAVEGDEGVSIDPSVLRVEVGQGKTAGEVLDGLHLWDFVSAGIAADEFHDEHKAGE